MIHRLWQIGFILGMLGLIPHVMAEGRVQISWKSGYVVSHDGLVYGWGLLPSYGETNIRPMPYVVPTVNDGLALYLYGGSSADQVFIRGIDGNVYTWGTLQPPLVSPSKINFTGVPFKPISIASWESFAQSGFSSANADGSCLVKNILYTVDSPAVQVRPSGCLHADGSVYYKENSQYSRVLDIPVVSKVEGAYAIDLAGNLWNISESSKHQLTDWPPMIVDVRFSYSGGHLWGLARDGFLWRWEVSESPLFSYTRPEKVLGPEQVAEFSASFDTLTYVRRDGTVWSMGNNEYGQLGDGTTVNRALPVPVLRPDGQGQLVVFDAFDRVARWGEWKWREIFYGPRTEAVHFGARYRCYPLANVCVAKAHGRLLVGPSLLGAIDLGPVENWLPSALQDGF